MVRRLVITVFIGFYVAFAAIAQTPAVKSGLTDLAYSVQPDNSVYLTGKHQGKSVNLVRNGAMGSGKWTIYTGTVTDRVRLTIDDQQGLQEVLAMDKGQRMTVNRIGQERIEYRLYAPDRSFIMGSVLYRKDKRWLQGLMRTEAFAGYAALTRVTDVTSSFALQPGTPTTQLADWLKDRWQGLNLISTAHAGIGDDLFRGWFSQPAQDTRENWRAPLHEMFKGSLAGAAAFTVKLVAQTVGTGETVAVGSALVAAAPFLVAVGAGVVVGVAADKTKNWLDSRNLGGTTSVSDFYDRLVAGTKFSRDRAPEAPEALEPVIADSPGRKSAPSSLLDMVDRLDKLDSLEQQEFRTALDEANECTRNRSFDCTELRITKASKLANGSSDRWLVTVARQNMANQKTRMAEEAKQLAAQERQRAEAEQQLLAQAEQTRRQQASESKSDSFQWAKAGALLGGSLIGGLNKLSPEIQGKVLTGILRDSAGGQGGMGNVNSALNSSPAAKGNGASRGQTGTPTQIAQGSSACGRRGEIIWISDPSEIPMNCQRGRQNNWVTSEERSPNADQICNKATVPTSDITGKPIPAEKVSNMSACFCGKNLKASYGGIPLKCWTFYDGPAF